MQADHYAKEADRLQNDDTLNYALDKLRSEALEELASVDADNKTDIIRRQQMVLLIDEIRAELRRAIANRPNANSARGTFA